MNASKLIVLGALDEVGRASGYDIDRFLQQKMIDRWTDIKRASIYHALKSLSASGAINQVEVVKAGAYPEKTLYEITDAGRSQFDALQREAALGLFPKFYGFKLALKLNRRLGASEIRELATSAIERIDAMVEAMDAHLSGVDDERMREFDEVFIAHDRELFAVERAWILRATEWTIARDTRIS